VKLVDKAFLNRLLAAAIMGGIALAPAALAQRKIIGSSDDEATDAGPPPATDDKDDKKGDKKDDKKSKKDKKAEEDAKKKAEEDKKKAEEDKKKKGKPDDKSKDAKDEKKDAKKDDKRDVLADTPAETAKKNKDDEARAAAEKKADEAAEAEKKKKEEEARKLAEDKKAADDKKKLENKDARLAAARKIRNISRSSGPIGVSFAIEPGEVKSNSVVEIRVDLTQKLDVADPKYGTLMPLKGLDLVAVVSQPTGKKDNKSLKYALHPLEAAGRYGFHTTPLKDGLYQVSIQGTTKDGKSVDASFPLHVGVWPPPDFEEEEKNNLATTDANRAGRQVLGK
jgi:murein DD-endopeptidase MepM/ murein hydrolase activator NlpD